VVGSFVTGLAWVLLRVREAGGDTIFSLKSLLALTCLMGFNFFTREGRGSRTKVENETKEVTNAVALVFVGVIEVMIEGCEIRVRVEIEKNFRAPPFSTS